MILTVNGYGVTTFVPGASATHGIGIGPERRYGNGDGTTSCHSDVQEPFGIRAVGLKRKRGIRIPRDLGDGDAGGWNVLKLYRIAVGYEVFDADVGGASRGFIRWLMFSFGSWRVASFALALLFVIYCCLHTYFPFELPGRLMALGLDLSSGSHSTYHGSVFQSLKPEFWSVLPGAAGSAPFQRDRLLGPTRG